MIIHALGEDYLEAILMLQKKNGAVRSIDLARHMEVSKPSVSHAVKTLREGGFLITDKDYCLRLTDIGREVAEKIYEYIELSILTISDKSKWDGIIRLIQKYGNSICWIPRRMAGRRMGGPGGSGMTKMQKGRKSDCGEDKKYRRTEGEPDTVWYPAELMKKSI